MEVIFILLPLAILIAGVMLALFIWAVKSGQYDDLETPAHRILFDEDQATPRQRATDAGADNGVETMTRGPKPLQSRDQKTRAPQERGSESP